MSKFKVSAHLVPGERSPPGLFFLFLICPHMAFSLVHVDGEKDKERKVTVESWGKERIFSSSLKATNPILKAQPHDLILTASQRPHLQIL